MDGPDKYVHVETYGALITALNEKDRKWVESLEKRIEQLEKIVNDKELKTDGSTTSED